MTTNLRPVGTGGPGRAVGHDTDEREDHTAAIRGEPGILPVPCGPPLFRLVTASGLEAEPIPEAGQFAVGGAEEAGPDEDPPGCRQPPAAQEPFDHDTGHGRVPRRGIGSGEQVAYPGPQTTTADGRPAVGGTVQGVLRFEPYRTAKGPGCFPVAALRVTLVGQSAQVEGSGGRFEHGGDAEVSSGGLELLGVQAQLSGQASRRRGPFHRQVAAGYQALEAG
jgi:hypothetical protein